MPDARMLGIPGKEHTMDWFVSLASFLSLGLAALGLVVLFVIGCNRI